MLHNGFELEYRVMNTVFENYLKSLIFIQAGEESEMKIDNVF